MGWFTIHGGGATEQHVRMRMILEYKREFLRLAGNNYLLPISRVLQGRTENFEKKSVFQRGFETFLSVFHPEL